MNNFFNPRSVAVIGASEDRKKVGGMILENLLAGGFAGSIFPVNPKGGTIQSLPVWEKIGDITEPVDLAVIALPAEKVAEAVRQCGESQGGVKNLIIVSAGFSEAGEEGRKRAEEIAGLVKKYSLQIAGPNCLGMINPWNKLNASFVGAQAKPGKIGLIMQSGAFVSAFLDWGQEFGLGFSAVATIGNKTFLDEVDFLEYFIQDEKTELLGFYLENFARGREFCQKIRTVSARKPVLILLADGGEKTRKAALSHTASMAGQAAVAKRALEEAGALVFDKPRDFLLALRYFSHFKIPEGRKVLFLTNAGGPGVVAMGVAEKSGKVEIFELSEQQKEELKTVLPLAASVANPIDLLGDADENRFALVLEKIKKFKDLGSAAVLLTRQKQTDQEKIFQEIKKQQADCLFPILPVFMTGKAGSDQLKAETFSFFEEALVGLEAGVSWKENSALKVKTATREKNSLRQKEAEEIFQAAIKAGQSAFYYPQSRQLGVSYGFSLADGAYLEDFLSQAEKVFPVVLKVDDPEIVHKEARSGVVLDIKNMAELEEAAECLEKSFPGKNFLVQSQQTAGMEIILGLKKDPAFGPVVLCGLGGILTEFLGEKMLFFPTQEKEPVLSLLEASRLGKILKRKKIEPLRLVEEIEKLFSLAEENEWIKELDINPLLVYPDQDFVAVDFKVLF